MRYTYDIAGRLATITWPDGTSIFYSFDLTGEQTGILTLSDNSTVTSQSYDSLGRRQVFNRRNGVTSTYGYDAISELTSLNITLAFAPAANVNYAFTYNPAGQIASKSVSNGAYVYGGNSAQSSSYTPNSLNQITSTSGSGASSFGYDGRGNLNSTATNGYSYDQENNLAGTTSGASLAYDAAGRLMSITSAGDTRNFMYAGQQVILELGSTGNVLRRFVPGIGTDNDTLMWFEGRDLSNPRWLIPDQQGSVAAVTDNSGKPIATNTYDAYGMPAPANSGRQQYGGQIWLSEVGLYHYKARAYHPGMRRFLQTDPAGYDAGMNLYAYVGGDPVNGVDPSGMCDDDEVCIVSTPLTDQPGGVGPIGGVGGSIDNPGEITIRANKFVHVSPFLPTYLRAQGGGTSSGCSNGPAKQIGVSYSGNVFVFLGGGSVSITLGVSLPNQGSGWQAFLAGEFDLMGGLGLNAGTSIGPTWGGSPTPMAAGFSVNETGTHAEGGAGLAYGAGMGITVLPDGTVSTSVGFAGPPLPALKAGAYVGGGRAYSAQLATPQFGCS